MARLPRLLELAGTAEPGSAAQVVAAAAPEAVHLGPARIAYSPERWRLEEKLSCHGCTQCGRALESSPTSPQQGLGLATINHGTLASGIAIPCVRMNKQGSTNRLWEETSKRKSTATKAEEEAAAAVETRSERGEKK